MRIRHAQWGVILSAFFGISATAATLYVSLNSTNPVPPYADWSTAATNIQDAIDTSSDGDLILVTNGVYASGGRVVYGSLTNRVVINKAVTVQSVTDPTMTAIQGYQVPGTTNGNNAIRCVYLTNNAALIGFTILGGATRTSGDTLHEDNGGGIWCESTNAFITNCVLVYNCANSNAGAVYSGTLVDCTLSNNSVVPSSHVVIASGGGACNSALYHCTLADNSVINTSSLSYGGGACNCWLSNCVLLGNQAFSGAEWSLGGGAYGSTLYNCTLISNSVSSTNNSGLVSSGGGADSATLIGCTLLNNSALPSGPLSNGSGGGVNNSIVSNCRLTGNAAGAGGGADSSTLINCILNANVADSTGGGASGGVLINCTVVSNSQTATYPPSLVGGGGIYGSSAANCIIYSNSSAADAPNYSYMNNIPLLTNCCTFPLPTNGGEWNITNAPQFANLSASDFHLQSNSPCINAGSNAFVSSTVDFDGNPRVVGVAVDMGAYEYQGPTSILPFVWLLQYGLPTDGSVDYADLDGTGLNVYQDWIAGLNPTNALSVLAMLPPVHTNNPPGLVVSWESVTNRTYFLQRTQNLARQPFSTIGRNIVGQTGTTSFKDSTAPGPGPYFYRVGVQ